MEITHSFAGAIPIFHLDGRLDVTTSPLLEERLKPLLNQDAQKIVFDCAALTYVSSAGLRVFIATLREVSKKGGNVAFATLTPPVLELFRLAGLDGLFIIEISVKEALTRF